MKERNPVMKLFIAVIICSTSLAYLHYLPTFFSLCLSHSVLSHTACVWGVLLLLKVPLCCRLQIKRIYSQFSASSSLSDCLSFYSTALSFVCFPETSQFLTLNSFICESKVSADYVMQVVHQQHSHLFTPSASTVALLSHCSVRLSKPSYLVHCIKMCNKSLK